MAEISNNKRIAKNTMMLYMRMLLTMVVSLYTSRVVLEVLGVSDFGIYNVVGGVVAMFGFINGSLAITTQRFISFELGKQNIEQLKMVFGVSCSIHVFLAVVVILLSETVGVWFLSSELNIDPTRMSAVMWVYHFSVLTVALNIVQVPYNAIIIAHERMDVFAFVSIIEVVLKLLIVFVLQYCTYDKLKMYGVFLFLVAFLVQVVYRESAKRMFKECITGYRFEKKTFLEMFSFSGWSLFGSVAYVAKSQGVNILLNIFYTTTVNAAWAISQQVNTAITLFSQNFTTAMNPPIIKAYANNNIVDTYRLLFFGMKISFFLSFCLIIPLVFETNYIFSLWLTTIPEYAIGFTKLILITSLLESFAYAIGTTVQATGRIRYYQVVIGGLLFLNLPFSYLVINLTGSPLSPLIVAICISVISLLFRFILLHRLIRYPINSLLNVFLLVALLCIFNIPIVFLLNWNMNPCFLRLVLSFASVLIISSGLLYFFGLSKEERKQINELINRFKTRIKK